MPREKKACVTALYHTWTWNKILFSSFNYIPLKVKHLIYPIVLIIKNFIHL
jgi:hypothetical protein